MDTDGGRVIGATVSRGAGDIESLAHRLDAIIDSLDWSGPDADAARATWRHHSQPKLIRTSFYLHALAAHLLAEAEQQDHGSAVASLTAAGVPTPMPAPTLESVGTGDWLDDRLEAVESALTRTGRAAGDFSTLVFDLLTGRREVALSTLAASALIVAGSGVGAVVNAVSGEDAYVFAESTGRVGRAVAVGTQAGPGQAPLTPPRDLPGLMQGVSDAYLVGTAPGSQGDIRITQVTNADGQTGYVVAIPGTERWDPRATGHVRDLTGNLHVMAGNPAAAAETVREAMAAAGIPPGAPVMMVGHSQGGMIAATLATDPAFLSDYRLTHVLTYGAPIDHLAIDPSVKVLQMQHRLDVVPRLDLGGWPTTHATPPTVTLASPGWSPVTNHSHVAYNNSVLTALGQGGADSDTLRAWQNDPGLAVFLVGEGEGATAVDVPIGRDRRP
jgi:hypothetical protein